MRRVFLLFLAILLSVVIFKYSGIRLANQQKVSQEEIETFIDAQIPKEATDIHIAFFGGQDSFALIAFRFGDAQIIEDFISELGYKGEITPNYYPDMHGEYYEERGLKWWQPHKSKKYSGVDFSIGLSKVFRLLIDETQSDYNMIYIIASE